VRGDAGLKRKRGAQVARKEKKGAGLGCEGEMRAAREGKESRAGPLRVAGLVWLGFGSGLVYLFSFLFSISNTT